MSVAALGLTVGVLAVLPTGVSKPGATAHHRNTSSPTTTVPVSSGTTTTSVANAATGVHVAVLAASGTSSASIESKLRTAGAVIVPENPIPASWVSSLAGPVIHYPSGLSSAAAAIAHVLGVSSSVVSEELPGTSDGAAVVEVFLPAS